MGRIIVAIGLISLLAALSAFAWIATYPDPYDPKNMRYVLWKHGLISMDLDIAASNVGRDAEGRSLIIGKSLQQLQDRFGFLLTPHQAGPGLEWCANNSWTVGHHPLFIRHTPVVVTFANGLAIQTGVLKPC